MHSVEFSSNTVRPNPPILGFNLERSVNEELLSEMSDIHMQMYIYIYIKVCI